ncbi:hypothetical protein MPER_06652, partial [Moniliophthora perniciosa FA553]
KGTEYPEHETEYGTHWNFFISLALLPLMQTVLHPLMVHFSVTFIGVAVAIRICFQCATCKRTQCKQRRGCFSNRRIQKQLKTGITKVTDSSDKGLDAPRQTDKTATELCAYAAMWWILMGITRYFHLDGRGGSSRRLVNMSYILWVSAYNTSFILGYMVLDMLFFPTRRPSKSSKSTDDGPIHDSEIPPPLLSAINMNGLAIFLLANVATGAINLTIPTLDTSNFWAMYEHLEYCAARSRTGLPSQWY